MDAKASLRDRIAARKQRLSALCRNRRGAAMLEFALVATPLIALLVGILTVALTFFAQQLLETANEKASRELMTGNAQKSAMTKDEFHAFACDNLPSFMDCSRLLIDVEASSDFSAVSTQTPQITFDSSGQPEDNFGYQPGNPGEITVVKMMYVWPLGKGLLGLDFSDTGSGEHLLVATSVFKTEVYA